MRTPSLLAVCFCAGLLGALINSAAVWLCGDLGLTEIAGVAIHPRMSTAWLYPRLVWGGLWGLAFFLTVAHRNQRRHWVRKGMLVSLLPTLYQLLVVFPYHTAHGTLGISLGTLTPLFVFMFNLLWGIMTGIFARLLWGRG